MFRQKRKEYRERVIELRQKLAEQYQRLAELQRQLSEVESAESEVSAKVFANEEKEGALLGREDMMLQEIELAESRATLFNSSSGIGFPSGMVIDLADVPECDGYSYWDPTVPLGLTLDPVGIDEATVDNLSNS